jgi:proteasome lid subunit RPN8/RPN11
MSCRVNSALAQSHLASSLGLDRASVQHSPHTCHFTIDPILLRRIVSHMRRCLPVEGVGLLATMPGKDGPIADAYYPGTNISASATRFVMDPRDVRMAIDDMARNGTSLGAVVHSHPTTIAEPSPIDLREATLADALSIIVGFQPHLSIRAWRLLFSPSGKAFAAVECPIVTKTAVAGVWNARGSSRADRKHES